MPTPGLFGPSEHLAEFGGGSRTTGWPKNSSGAGPLLGKRRLTVWRSGITAAASRSAFQAQGSSRSSSWALVRPETMRSSTSVSQARGSTPFSFAVADQAGHDRPVAGPAIRAGEQGVLAAQGHHGVILPMSGRRPSSITAGIRCTGGASGGTTARIVSPAASSTSRWRPAWSRSCAAWMLDPVACAGMELGPPRVSVAALADLHHLLIERGSRRCSRGGSNTVQEEHHGEPAETGTAIHDTSPAEHGAGLRKAAGDERSPSAPRLWRGWPIS